MFRSYDHLQTNIFATRRNYSADNLNKTVNNYYVMLSHANFRRIYSRMKMVVRPKQVADNLNKIVNNSYVMLSHVNFRRMYDRNK
jgi:hypothetical protein